ncbi:UNVERIFIED_CONTAM: PadR family transcriptional regulator, partial [Bacillus subtilis]
MHGMIFLPKWVHAHHDIMVCYKNDHTDLMNECREKYEPYPKDDVPECAEFTVLKNEGVENEERISKAPYEGMTEDI